MLKWCYRQTPRFGYCPIPDVGKLKALTSAYLNDIENVLRYFHLGLQEYLKSQSAFVRAQILGNADSTVVGAIFSCAKPSDAAARQKALCEHVKPLLLRIKSSWSDVDVDNLPDFCEIGSAAQESASTVDASSALSPRVISYDKLGAPITFQDEVEVAVEITVEEFFMGRLACA